MWKLLLLPWTAWALPCPRCSARLQRPSALMQLLWLRISGTRALTATGGQAETQRSQTQLQPGWKSDSWVFWTKKNKIEQHNRIAWKNIGKHRTLQEIWRFNWIVISSVKQPTKLPSSWAASDKQFMDIRRHHGEPVAALGKPHAYERNKYHRFRLTLRVQWSRAKFSRWVTTGINKNSGILLIQLLAMQKNIRIHTGCFTEWNFVMNPVKIKRLLFFPRSFRANFEWQTIPPSLNMFKSSMQKRGRIPQCKPLNKLVSTWVLLQLWQPQLRCSQLSTSTLKSTSN